ncbi:MAG: hypothetical protein GY906_07150 [bacterium]|nr:hypothetical protein [bacterium]
MNRNTLNLSVLAICLIWAAVDLPRMVTGPWSSSSEAAISLTGSILRLSLLFITAWAATRGLRSVERDNPARASRVLLAIGFCVFFAAQATLFCIAQASGGVAPYPSIADAMFVVGLVLLIVGVAMAIRAWLTLGIFPDGGRRAMTAASIATVPLVVGVAFTLVSLPTDITPIPQLLVDTAYPVLDSILLILTVAMFRLTLLLGRGSVGAVWRSLLLGFLLTGIADVTYSFSVGFSLDWLDPLFDLLFTVSYALFAHGTLLQMRERT